PAFAGMTGEGGALDSAPLISDISVVTEMTIESRKLAPAVERFVLHWGDMGNQWGVNRSVAQLHALLYLSERPLPAEELVETLDRWYDQMLGVPPAKIMSLINMGSKVVNFLSFGRGRKARES